MRVSPAVLCCVALAGSCDSLDNDPTSPQVGAGFHPTFSQLSAPDQDQAMRLFRLHGADLARAVYALEPSSDWRAELTRMREPAYRAHFHDRGFALPFTTAMAAEVNRRDLMLGRAPSFPDVEPNR